MSAPLKQHSSPTAGMVIMDSHVLPLALSPRADIPKGSWPCCPLNLDTAFKSISTQCY